MKAFKKTSAAVLTLGLLFGSLPYAVYADASTVLTTAGTATTTQVTQDQAVELAREYFPILASVKCESVAYRSGQLLPYSDHNTWVMRFDALKGTDQPNVTLNAETGALISFRLERTVDVKPDSPISRSTAQQKAEGYLKQFAPETAEQITLDEKNTQAITNAKGELGYQIQYVRTVNGIPFPSNYVTIKVDNQGELIGLDNQWSEQLQFPTQVTPSVSMDEAKTAYRKALNLQLSYQLQYRNNMINKVNMLYNLENAGEEIAFPLIDAQSGLPLNGDGTPMPVEATPLQPLAEKPGSAPSTHKLTDKEALDIISKLDLGLSGYTLQHTEYVSKDQYTDRQNYWSFDYTSGTDDETQKSASVQIDANTGELLQMSVDYYHSYPPQVPVPTETPMTMEQAKQKVIDVISHALPTKLDQLALDLSASNRMIDPSEGYQFLFAHLVNGIPVKGDYAEVSLDPTGNVIHFATFDDQSKVTFPAKDKAVSVDKAKDKFIERFPLQLEYVPIIENNSNYQAKQKITSVVLAYAPQTGTTTEKIDALTGEWVKNQKLDPPPTIQDIKGHWAEKQLRTLAYFGILPVTDGHLYPNAVLTRGEAVDTWVRASSIDNGYSFDGYVNTQRFTDVPNTNPYYDSIQEAQYLNWIDHTKTFRPADQMTRAELADLVVKSIGETTLAQSPNLFQNHFTDVKSSNAYFSDITIVSALGLMGGNKGAFAPDQPVSKAQLAVVLFNVMSYMAENSHQLFGDR